MFTAGHNKYIVVVDDDVSTTHVVNKDGSVGADNGKGKSRSLVAMLPHAPKNV